MAAELGNLLMQYDAKNPGRELTGVVLGVGMAFLGLVLLIVEASSDSGFMFALMCLGSMIAVGSGAGVIRGLRGSARRIEAYSEGLVLYTRSGETVIRWQKITQVWVSRVQTRSTTILTYTLHYGEAEPLTLSSRSFEIGELAAVGRLLEEEVTKHLLPTFEQHLQSGRPIWFGALEATPEGLRNPENKETLHWEEVSEIAVGRTAVVVRQKERNRPWLNPRMGGIRNLAVLLALAERRGVEVAR